MSRRLCALLLAVCALMLCAPAKALQSRRTTDYFATVSALFLDTENISAPWQRVKEILGEIESAVSLSIEHSDLSRFNRLAAGESCEVSDITAQIFQVAKKAYEATGGLYDPTVYPLVDLWGFSPRFNQNRYSPVLPYDRAYVDGRLPLPRDEHVQALRPLIGLDGIELSGSSETGWILTKRTPSVTVDGVGIHAQLDLGGIAKGYACDRVVEMLREEGYIVGHFVCGGSSIAMLTGPEGDYQLTIGKSRPGENDDTHFATVYANNTTLSTSSDASHSYLRDGVLYCHLIDPRTGYPVNTPADAHSQQGIASVTLLGPSAALGDAMTTALCVMGPEAAIRFPVEGQTVIVMYDNSRDWLDVYSNLPASQFSITDGAYRPYEGVTP